MTVLSPTPWNFANESHQFFSPDGQQFLRYETGNINEVGMGGPLYGPGVWVKPNGVEVFLSETCGGPPVWQRKGAYVALPIWQHTWFYGWKSRIGIVDLSCDELILFEEKFRVLQLEKFEGQLITGIDSPIHQPKAVTVDITAARIERVISL